MEGVAENSSPVEKDSNNTIVIFLILEHRQTESNFCGKFKKQSQYQDWKCHTKVRTLQEEMCITSRLCDRLHSLVLCKIIQFSHFLIQYKKILLVISILFYYKAGSLELVFV